MSAVLQELEAWCSREQVRARTDLNGKDVTTYNIGGPLSLVIEPDTIEQLHALLKTCVRLNVDFRVLGAGSNLLVSDAGVALPIIRLGRGFRSLVTHPNATFEVGGAFALMTLSRQLSEAGLAGVEFLGGIPGSVGGGVRMNAGAHGSEMSAIVKQVGIVTATNGYEELNAQALRYRYRHSELPPGAIVVSARLALTESDREVTAQRRAHFLAERRARQPLQAPSAGSVFRNPSARVSAGKLIEQVGLKGTRSGGAVISELHANWIVNLERTAKAADVSALVELAQAKVLAQSNVLLKPEIILFP